MTDDDAALAQAALDNPFVRDRLRLSDGAPTRNTPAHRAAIRDLIDSPATGQHMTAVITALHHIYGWRGPVDLFVEYVRFIDGHAGPALRDSTGTVDLTKPFRHFFNEHNALVLAENTTTHGRERLDVPAHERFSDAHDFALATFDLLALWEPVLREAFHCQRTFPRAVWGTVAQGPHADKATSMTLLCMIAARVRTAADDPNARFEDRRNSRYIAT